MNHKMDDDDEDGHTILKGVDFTLKDYTHSHNIPHNVFNPSAGFLVQTKRQLRRWWSLSIHPFRYFFHLFVIYLGRLWKWWHTSDFSQQRSRWFRFKQWWAREGPFIKLAVLVGLGFGLFFLNILWNYVSHTQTYYALLEKASKALDKNMNPIQNLHLPAQTSMFLGTGPFDWIDPLTHSPLTSENITRGYLDCQIESLGGRHMNVTLPSLELLLRKSCPADETCVCAGASQVGLACPVLLLNRLESTLMIQPRIENASGKKIKADVKMHGTTFKTVETDSWILVEYYNSKGKLTREKYEMGEAVCLAVALAFNRGSPL